MGHRTFLEVDLHTVDLGKTAQDACEVVNILFNGGHEDHHIIDIYGSSANTSTAYKFVKQDMPSGQV